jgi:molybdate transport system ATP-binding protein
MIDLDIRAQVRDRHRVFDLTVTMRSQAGFIAIYGESGSGKSLTLQSVAGLLRPSQGHIRLAGRTLLDRARNIDVPPRERQLGYLLQDYALFPHLSVRENVLFGLTSWLWRRPSSSDAQRVDSLLERFELTGVAASRPATLSGGQKQRVALARAMAIEPAALLLDEPFSALNPMLRHSMRMELRQLHLQSGIPVIMITHDVQDVLELADQCFVMARGQVIRSIDMKTASSQDFAWTSAVDSATSARHQQLIGLLHAPLPPATASPPSPPSPPPQQAA